MPDNFNGAKLAFQVANIEDSTFPVVPEIGPPTSLPADELILENRTFYARHQLLGINPFALEMFDQFRTDLGLYQYDGLLPPEDQKTALGQKTAVEGAVILAQTMTAQVTINSATKSGGQLLADVQIQNLAGHKLPSGVSFRRAFLDFQVLDGAGKVLWESGGTNTDGVITDTAGNPLVTEFYSPTQQTIQPHFWTGNPITSDQQVQIYEERVLDPQGQLTTSFLALDTKVKDNRIQPNGNSSTGPNAGILAPVGTGADPSYQGGCGCSVVSYQLPTHGSTRERGASAGHFVLPEYSSWLSPRARLGRQWSGHPETDQLHERVERGDRIPRDCQLETENHQLRCRRYYSERSRNFAEKRTQVNRNVYDAAGGKERLTGHLCSQSDEYPSSRTSSPQPFSGCVTRDFY